MKTSPRFLVEKTTTDQTITIWNPLDHAVNGIFASRKHKWL